MGYIIFYIFIVILYIVLGCGHGNIMYQVFFGSQGPNSKKEKKSKNPEQYGWLTRKLHESNVRGAEKNRQLKEEIRQMKEHNAQLREVIRLQKEEKRKKKEEALRQRKEQK